jgi:hypothetical protein
MIFLWLLLLLISVLLEGTVTALPLVLLCLICMTISLRSSIIFFPAFIAGIFLDAFALRSIGGASIFLLITIFLILLYQRKYEINSYTFVLIASFLSSLVYLFLFNFNGVILLSCVSAVIAVLLLMLLRYTDQAFSV